MTANLRGIRLASGISQTAVARLAGLSRVAYRAIETGESIPRDATLARIARALHVTPELLNAESSTVDHIRFRAPRKLRSRADLIAFAVHRLSLYDGLEGMVGRSKHFPLSRFHWDLARHAAEGEAEDRIERAVLMARYQLHLPKYHPVPDLCAALEDNGIKVLTVAVASPAFTAFSISFAFFGSAIIVNQWRTSPERQLFAAAVELGHLLLHPSSYDITRTSPNPREAREATRFADSLLTPFFEPRWYATRGLSLYDRVLKLKHHFKIPWPTILRRAFPHTRSAHRRLPIPLRTEPDPLPDTLFLPLRHARLIRRALETRGRGGGPSLDSPLR